MVAGYEHQLKMLSLNAPAGLGVSTALHAASVGEERFNKGDCRGSARLFRCITTWGGGASTHDVVRTRAMSHNASNARAMRKLSQYNVFGFNLEHQPCEVLG